MFNGDKIESLRPNKEVGQSAENFSRDGFTKFEEKYHHLETYDLADNPEDDGERIQEFFKIDIDEINNVAGVIDTYIEEKISNEMDINQAEVDEIFDEDEFIAIIKPYGEAVAVPAICYWSTLKQAFVEYRDFETTYNGRAYETTGKHKRHENRVRAVTEMLISIFPPARLARWGYQFVTGKEPEILKKLDDTVSEKIVDASDATLYLSGKAGIGCLKVVENALEYGGATLEFLLHNEENAEKILSLDISGDLKKKLDELYGRDNWVAAISGSVERFGTTATYIGLTMLLPAGGIKAVAGSVGLLIGKAGEKTKQDYEKTGELTAKELAHGAISGAAMVFFAELGIAAVDKLGSSAPAIAKEINKIFGGKMDPKLLKSITASVVNGLEAGSMFAAYDVPEQVSKEIERALDIDPDAKADWMQTLGGAGVAILTAATFTFIKELYVNRGYYSTYEERISHTPVKNGEWTGDRGESKFISDSEEVSTYLKEANVDGVNYKDGCPDFNPFSKGEVEIPSMSPDRHTTMGKPGNFEQADTALARQRGDGCTARDVANWRKANGYTWHELNDMKTCQKVPSSINKVYGHLGGASECRHREDMMNEIIGKYTNKGGIFDE